jgi:hypothetical protein
MNPLIQFRRSIALSLIVLLLAYFGLLPKAQAVVPAPDGGYAGQNTAEGQSALLHLAGGTYNTALGWSSLGFNVTGSFNTAAGAGALLANTADQNTATGAGALLGNTTGNNNTANGAFALLSNTTGFENTAIGFDALSSNTNGAQNTADGARALRRNTTGTANTANGFQALDHNTSGNGNTAIGESALFSNLTSGGNTATGNQALYHNTGYENTAIGDGALINNSIGLNNTAVGGTALDFNTTGNNNIALGYNAGINVTTADNVICIGADGNNVDNACYIGQIFGVTSLNGTAVFINSNGRLGTLTSSARFKDEIKPMEQASEALFALKPVTFHYKKAIDPQGTPQLGLVAEDVEKVNPDLIVRDKEGKPYSVRYEAVNAMLLNEFLKEHRTVQEQKAIVAQLKQDFQSRLAEQQKQIEKLTAGLQKVSAQVEASKPAPHVAKNP